MSGRTIAERLTAVEQAAEALAAEVAAAKVEIEKWLEARRDDDRDGEGPG